MCSWLIYCNLFVAGQPAIFHDNFHSHIVRMRIFPARADKFLASVTSNANAKMFRFIFIFVFLHPNPAMAVHFGIGCTFVTRKAPGDWRTPRRFARSASRHYSAINYFVIPSDKMIDGRMILKTLPPRSSKAG
jgi:hypothetical protein